MQIFSAVASTPTTSHSAVATQIASRERTTSGGLTTNDLAMLFVVLIWGANFSIVKASFAQLPPLAFTALRFAVATLLVMLILRWREGAVRLSRATLWRLVWLGFVGNTLYQIVFITGLTMTTAANTALLVATTPVLVLLIGRVFGIEPLTRNTALGILLAFLGITLVMLARGAGVGWETLRGDLLALLAAFCWSVYTLGVRTLGADLSPLRITAWTMLTGTPGLIIAGLPQLAHTDWSQVDAFGWGGLAYAALLALVVAYLLWNTSVRRVGGSRTAVYACATPLVATVVAWYVLGEEFRPLQGVGAALIIGGVLLTRKRKKNDEERGRLLHEQIHTSVSA